MAAVNSVHNNEAQQIRRRRIEPFNDAGYEEISCAMVGSVDAAKSSTVGTLTTNTLDNGRGLSRSFVFVHAHEHDTGRTSDISYQYVVDEESKRVISFIDLAGHEMYLKTTISGLTSTFPDCAILCISDKITNMTKEHISLCIAMNIPFIILYTKIDMVPPDITSSLARQIRTMLKSQHRNTYQIKSLTDIPTAVKSIMTNVPFIYTSNKTGENLDLVRQILRVVPKRQHKLISGFVVEHIYNVMGHGTIVSGIVGQDVHKGDVLYIGPFSKGSFSSVKVKSLHNDYRFDLDMLGVGKRGCLCISISAKDKPFLRKGMILTKDIPKNICRSFTACVRIFHHHTTIKAGYQAAANCGMIRESVVFKKLTNDKGQPIDVIRSGDEVIAHLDFVNNLNYVEAGQIFVFREGTTRGIGTIIGPKNETPNVKAKSIWGNTPVVSALSNTNGKQGLNMDDILKLSFANNSKDHTISDHTTNT